MPIGEASLRTYVGYYHAYFYSFGWSGLIMRSLVSIHEHQGRILSKTIERVKEPFHGARYIIKYAGVATMRGDRIFIAEYDSLGREDFALTILYRTYRSHVDFPTGLTMGASSRPGRDPAAARTVYEFLGRTIDHRLALRRCGLYAPNARELDPRLVSTISNVPSGDETVLLGRIEKT